MDGLKDDSQRFPVPQLIGVVAATTGYLSFLGAGEPEGRPTAAAEENLERRENLRQLAEAATPFSEMEPPLGLQAFLEETALFSDADEYKEDKDAVTLITLHAAKGLEFPVVFLVGMEEGVCPHMRSFDAPEQMAEERRLCYVGMTRAIRRLYMTFSVYRTFYGTPSVNVPSRFVVELPEEFTTGWHAGGRKRDDKKMAGRGRTAAPWKAPAISPAARSGPSIEQPGTVTKTNEGKALPSRAQSARRTTMTLKPGDRVRHEKFGEGIVMEVNGAEDVTVLFPGAAGAKRLSLAYAPLTKI
jgi:DNA helicase-2/ATP-dependent DNA helicase PcrA